MRDHYKQDRQVHKIESEYPTARLHRVLLLGTIRVVNLPAGLMSFIPNVNHVDAPPFVQQRAVWLAFPHALQVCGLKIDARAACFSRLMNMPNRRWPHFRPKPLWLRHEADLWAGVPMTGISASPNPLQNRCIRSPRCASGYQLQLFNIFNIIFLHTLGLSRSRSTYKLNPKCITSPS